MEFREIFALYSEKDIKPISALSGQNKKKSKCRIWSSRSDGYEQFCLLVYNDVYPVENQPNVSEEYFACTFRV
jgi:hypothetical protein